MLRILKTVLSLAALCVVSLSAQAQAPAVKLGVIDVQKIITDSASGKAAAAKLEQFGNELAAKIEPKREELAALGKKIADGQNALAEDRLKDMRQEYQSKQLALTRAGEDAQREFNQRQEEMLKEIERKVMPVIQQVGQEGGYTLVLRKFDSGLVYAAEGIDITAAVISRLDAQSPAPAGN